MQTSAGSTPVPGTISFLNCLATVMPTSNDSEKVYKEALQLASFHYENFPVASIAFPKKLRKDVALIYSFARTADDLVDEGQNNDEEKLSLLNNFRNDFTDSLSENYKNKFWELLHNTIQQKNLNSKHFFDLLDAFEQDTKTKRYQSYNDLLNYCKKSANPVGRLILELYGIKNTEVISYSDDICTALQLTNFWQDVKIDLQKDRIYIPFEDIRKFNADEAIFNSEQTPDVLRQIVEYEIKRTEKLFAEGERILVYLPYRLRIQVGWTINGGRKILQKISKNNCDVLNYRPILSKFDYFITFAASLFR